MTEQEILFKKVLPYLRGLGYNVIRPEQQFGVGSRRVRVDAVAYDNRDAPAVLVETKRDLSSIGEEPNQYDPLVQQAFRSALVAESPYFLLSDGALLLWFRVDLSRGVPELIETPPQVALGPSGPTPFRQAEEVQQIVTSIMSYIRSQTHLPQGAAGEEVLKLLQAKVCDEHRIHAGYERQFYAGIDEDAEQVVDRVQRLYQQWSPQGMLSNEMQADTWAASVSLLEPFSLSHTDNNLLKPAFDEMISTYMKKNGGQFVTPHSLVDFMVQLAAPQPGERVLDPVCGTGGFLAAVLTRWRSEGINSGAATHVYGVDIDPLVAQWARVNVAVAGGQPENVLAANSLDQAVLDKMDVYRESFDVILANPPVGRVDVDNPALLEQYELAFKQGDSKLRRRQTKEVLFLEQCHQLLKPGGRMIVVVPEGILSSPAYQFVRKWLMQNTSIDAVIGLPVHTFTPYTGMKTNVLALTKEPLDANDQVFMAIAEEVGFDRRGRLSDKNDFPHILEEYHRYRENQLALTEEKAWVVPQAAQLVARLDPIFHRPEYRRMLEGLGRLSVPVMQLGEITETIIQGTAAAKFMSLETGVPIIGPRQISERRLHLIGARLVPQKLVETKLRRFALRPGDLLVSAYGKTGENAIVTEQDVPAIAGQGVIVVRPKSNVISTDFLWLLFATEWVQRQIDVHVQGSVIPRLYVNDLRRLLVPVPARSVQNEIAAQLRQAAALREEARALEQKALAALAALLEDTDSDAK